MSEEKKHSHSLKAHIEQTSELLHAEAKKKEHSTFFPSVAQSFVSQIGKMAKMLKKNIPGKRGAKRKK